MKGAHLHGLACITPHSCRQLIKLMWHASSELNNPWQVMFLNELEELLELTQSTEFAKVAEHLFRLIARCINSPHFQVRSYGTTSILP
jgi:hypothetical protein